MNIVTAGADGTILSSKK